MDPSISDLRYFLEVASTLNMTRASERLVVRQSTLSAAMRRLEETLGTQLLVRGRAGTRLTKAGQHFRRASQDFLEKWEALKFSTKEAAQEVSGVYSLGCHPNPGRYIMPMFFAELIRRHPKLQIQLTHERSQVLSEMVISSKLDFAIVSLVIPNPDLVVVKLGIDKLGIWAHPQLKVDPAETLLMLDPAVKHSQDLLRMLEKRGQAFRRTMASTSIEVIWALAEAGVGAAAMPNNPVLYSRNPGLRLQEHLPQAPAELSLIYRADMQKSVAAKAIASIIRDHCFRDQRIRRSPGQ